MLIDETLSSFTNTGQPYLALLHSAIITAAYFGTLRIGEVTQGEHILLAKNVHIGINKNKIMFILRSSKTHCEGDLPQIIKISGEKNKQGNRSNYPKRYCPFVILSDYMKARPRAASPDEQFFIFRDCTPVKPEQTRQHLKNTLKRLGFKDQLYCSMVLEEEELVIC